MAEAQESLIVPTAGQGFYELTTEVTEWANGRNIATGLLTLYCRHTSASLVIQENADAKVLDDLDAFFRKLAPEDASLYTHDAEGPDDMPAHIKAALTQTSLAIPVTAGRLALGKWQGIFLIEHRSRARRREMVMHLSGA